jgi:hypothetical protein
MKQEGSLLCLEQPATAPTLSGMKSIHIKFPYDSF